MLKYIHININSFNINKMSSNNTKSDVGLDLNNLSKEDLIELRDKTVKTRYEHYKLYNELYHNIQIIEKVLYSKCKHEWELDFSGCGPHDGPDKICKLCNLYK